MNSRRKAVLILEKKLCKPIRHIAVDDLERFLRNELDKPADEEDTVLI